MVPVMCCSLPVTNGGHRKLAFCLCTFFYFIGWIIHFIKDRLQCQCNSEGLRFRIFAGATEFLTSCAEFSPVYFCPLVCICVNVCSFKNGYQGSQYFNKC
jgi:hypothetical protein